MEEFEYCAKEFVLYLLGNKKPLGTVFQGMPRTAGIWKELVGSIAKEQDVRGKEISWKTYGVAVQQKVLKTKARMMEGE